MLLRNLSRDTLRDLEDGPPMMAALPGGPTMDATATEQRTGVERLLRKREVAEALGVTTRCLDLWRQSGRIRAVRLGPGAIRFRAADVERLIAESVEAASDAAN